MTEKVRIPQIRFKGFTDPWEQCKVKELFKITRGYVLATTNTQEEFSKYAPYPVYSSQTKDNGLLGYYKDYLYEDAITWTTDGANAGTVNFRPGKFYCTNVCGVLLSDKLNTCRMVAEALNNVSKNYVSYVGNPKLMNNVMAEIPLMLVFNNEEREKISSIFYKLDNLITLHQRKHDKLVNVKKSLLEKMFPNDGEKVPKIRFKGFTDPWEQCKFENIFNYERPDAYIVKSDKYSDTYKTPVLTANKGFILGYTNETNTHHNPCIIFDDFTLDSKYVTFDFMVKSSAMKILNVKNGYNLRFAYERLNSEKLENLGHARHYISVVQPTETLVPKIAEQEKISKLFNYLEDNITLHQSKLEKLKNIKKSLLKKMFV